MKDTTQDAETSKPDITEIATSLDGRDITQPFVGALRPNDDPILAARGGGLEIYEEVLRDAQVFSCFQQRISALVSAEWEVRPAKGATDTASKKAADMLAEQLDNILFDQACRKMLYGLFYGYAIGEMLWVKDGATFAIDAIKVRRARRFRYDKHGGLRLLTQNNMHEGELMPARKFWTFTSGSQDDDTLYGRGLAYWCFWPALFKRHDLKFWLTFLDKYGGPTSIGKYPAGTSEEDINKLLGALVAMRSDSAVVMPDGMIAELLEATRGSAADFDKFHDRMDASISKVILSQTMTTDSGSSLSQSEVHLDVREDVVKADADILCASFNQGPAKWLTEWNYPGAKPPQLWRAVEPPEDLDKLAERDTKIYQMGYRPSAEYVKETYGEGWEPDPTRQQDATQTALQPGQETPAQFAEPGDASSPDIIQQATGDLYSDWEELMAPIVDPIRDQLESATSIEDFRDKIVDRLDGMDDAQFAEHMARLGFSARLTGETGAPISGSEDPDANPTDEG
ncbi:Mu-like prophage FluMu protein gp29 [Candidatus Phaeomarinobacter ectocarpi]|uniref:Mu-like prophage FluMu protein gp29 n=1 Tax=Candidatus Phaeomarinibacter ectocarpi TaxID=1458461 RepID=X5MMY8_9HYPH|nr:DUF935 family protein [Candidatus Phaeomarinobacter ectocarpi]CDO60820.1 Mu-like prophage FluMu protein gp29 [Candidatus Phaeomarinobacter ectocarpi]